MPKEGGVEKQKKQKDPSRKARGQMTRKTMRAQTHSDITFERFMRGQEPDLFLAKVTRAVGAGRFDLEGTDSGVYLAVPIKGTLTVSRKAAHNPATRAAVEVGGYVLTDGGRIQSVLTTEEAGQARRKLGASSLGSARSKDSLFSWGSYKNRSLEEKAATRKRGHKGERSRSRSRSSSARSSVSSVKSANVFLVSGKKVYTAAGEKLHGEDLRAAKKHLASLA
jgi:hypothetical protein